MCWKDNFKRNVMLFSALLFRDLDSWFYALFGFPVDNDFVSSCSPMKPFHTEPGWMMSRFQQFAIIWCRAYNPVVVSAAVLSLLDYLHLLLFSSLCPLLIFHFVELLSWLMPVPFRCHLWNSWWFLLGCCCISPRSSANWCLLCRVLPGFLATFLHLVPYVLCGCFIRVYGGCCDRFVNVQQIIFFFPQGPSPFYCLDFYQESYPVLCLGTPLIHAFFVSCFRKICSVHCSPFY